MDHMTSHVGSCGIISGGVAMCDAHDIIAGVKTGDSIARAQPG